MMKTSQNFMANLKIQNIQKYTLNPTKCKKCNIDLPYEKRNNDFCSHNCSAKYNNLGVQRNKSNPSKHCKICNNRMKPSPTQNGMCKKCYLISIIEERMKSGGPIHSARLRKYIVKERGHKCEECKNTIWNNQKITLHVHHIDGNTYNNKRENLKLLCPNCHSQTPNYCSKNKGNGKYKIVRVPKVIGDF